MNTNRPGRRTVTVHFFRAILDGQYDPLRLLDLKALHDAINAHGFDKNAAVSRYCTNADGQTYMAWPELSMDRLRMLVARVLPEAAPSYELEGSYKIANLPGGGSWVAPTHCVFFPTTGIMGAIFSQEGPRVDRIALYLERVGQAPHDIVFELVVREDIDQELSRLSGVRRLKLQFHPSNTPSLFHGHHDDLDATLEALVTMRDARTVTIIIDAGKKKGASLGDFHRRLLQLFKGSQFTASATQFEVSGPDVYTRKNLEIDLITPHLSASKVVPLGEGGRALEKEAAYRAVEAAYAERIAQFPSVRITGP